MIEIYDDVCTYKENIELYNVLLNGRFEYGEFDLPHHPPTGLIATIDQTSDVFKRLLELIRSKPSKNLSLNNQTNLLRDAHKYSGIVFEGHSGVSVRSYVNLFLPNERPFFHPDGNVITCLFYFTPEYDIDEGGETQFYVDSQLLGVLPKPGRLVVFDGNIQHRATSYRTKPRITVAIKFRVNG